MMKNILIKLIMTAIFITACGPSTEQIAATMAAGTVQAQQGTEFVQQSIQDTVAAVEAAFTLTPTFTLTFTPEPVYTETPIPSATIIPMAEVTVETATIWSGPGIAFPSLKTAIQGDTFKVFGRSADGSWVVVLVDEVRTKGWVSISDVKIEGGISGLLVIQSPPTPTIPTVTTSTSTTVKVTIINNSSKSALIYFHLEDGSFRKIIQAKPGKEITLIVPKGVYLGFSQFAGVNCNERTVNLVNDILWIVTDSFTCAQDPLP